jgi:elongation factor G
VGGSVPKEYIPAIEKGCKESLAYGALADYPVNNVCVKLLDGSYHDVDSNEMAFKAATSIAMREGMVKAGPALLEPVMDIEIETPEEYMGDIMADFNSRRARVGQLELRGNLQLIKGKIPLGETFGYATALRSLSQGRATFTMVFAEYAEVPRQITEEIVKSVRGISFNF